MDVIEFDSDNTSTSRPDLQMLFHIYQITSSLYPPLLWDSACAALVNRSALPCLSRPTFHQPTTGPHPSHRCCSEIWICLPPLPFFAYFSHSHVSNLNWTGMIEGGEGLCSSDKTRAPVDFYKIHLALPQVMPSIGSDPTRITGNGKPYCQRQLPDWMDGWMDPCITSQTDTKNRKFPPPKRTFLFKKKREKKPDFSARITWMPSFASQRIKNKNKKQKTRQLSRWRAMDRAPRVPGKVNIWLMDV